MNKGGENILQEFDACKDILQAFGEAVFQLLKSLLSHYNIKPHQLSYRVKERKSLEKKMERKSYKYNSLNELTDLVGFRVINYFEDDIDFVADLVQNEFEVDNYNSIDKRQLENDRFGYRSLHFVFSLRPERLKLTEYKKFAGMKAEVQIRSILQHSWAEIEHDLGYKGESEIPETAKRTFYRVAALLEQADIEFVKLRAEIKLYEDAVKKKIQANPASVLIDKASLLSFIRENPILEALEIKVEKELKIKREDIEKSTVSNSLVRFEKLKVTTVKQLEDLYRKNEREILSWIRKFIKEYEVQDGSITFSAGASLYWLGEVLKTKSSS